MWSGNLAWRIEFDQVALDSLRRMDREIQRRVLLFLREDVGLADNPRQWGKPLRGSMRGLWRYRIGDYRILCQLVDADCVVLVVDVGHRSHIYDR